jgi:hypothetical protein
MGITGPLDLQFGPDGALYILNYGNAYFNTSTETKIARIEYTGTCSPAVAIHEGGAESRGSIRPGNRFTVDWQGAYSIRVQDLKGRQLARVAGLRDHGEYAIADLVPAGTPKGLLTVTVSGDARTERFRIFKD